MADEAPTILTEDEIGIICASLGFSALVINSLDTTSEVAPPVYTAMAELKAKMLKFITDDNGKVAIAPQIISMDDTLLGYLYHLKILLMSRVANALKKPKEIFQLN